MIYREQSDEINNGTRPSTDVSFLKCAAKVLFRDATDLQHQILLINISHVATAISHEVSQGSYVTRSGKLVKRQQAHAVIEIIINARLT